MNAKMLVFVICVEAIIHLVLYNVHDCTFKNLHPEAYLGHSQTSKMEHFTKIANR